MHWIPICCTWWRPTKTLPPIEANSLNGVIDLLHQTPILIKLYNDKRPINSTNDPRLTQLQSIRTWFQSWELSAESHKELMYSECRQGLVWMLLGFDSLRTLAMEQCSIPIYLCDINSDIIAIFSVHKEESAKEIRRIHQCIITFTTSTASFLDSHQFLQNLILEATVQLLDHTITQLQDPCDQGKQGNGTWITSVKSN